MVSQTTSSGMRSDPVLELARRGAVQLAVGGPTTMVEPSKELDGAAAM